MDATQAYLLSRVRHPWRARARLSIAQTISSTGTYTLGFDTAEYDSTVSWYFFAGATKYIVPNTGYYALSLALNVTTSSTGGFYVFCSSIYKNGSELARGSQPLTTNTSASFVTTTKTVEQLNAGDYLQPVLNLQQMPGGGSVTLDAGSSVTYFDIHFLSSA